MKEYIGVEWKFADSVGPILSIVGNSGTLTTNIRIINAFKEALIQVTNHTKAWLITDGLNTGVARMVTDAVFENFYSGNVMAIADLAHIRNRAAKLKVNKIIE